MIRETTLGKCNRSSTWFPGSTRSRPVANFFRAADAKPVGTKDFRHAVDANHHTGHKTKNVTGVASDDHPRPGLINGRLCSTFLVGSSLHKLLIVLIAVLSDMFRICTMCINTINIYISKYENHISFMSSSTCSYFYHIFIIFHIFHIKFRDVSVRVTSCTGERPTSR